MLHSHTILVLSSAFLLGCALGPKSVGELTGDGSETGSGGSDSQTASSTGPGGTGQATDSNPGGTSTTTAPPTSGSTSSTSSSTSGGSTSSGSTSEGPTPEPPIPPIDLYTPECEVFGCEKDEVCTPEGCQGGVIFLNFDGPTMTHGSPDDATMDQTTLSSQAGLMNPFGGSAQDHDTLVAEVSQVFADFSVYVTRERPYVAPYYMVVLGDNLDRPGGTLATIGCGAWTNPVGFAGVYDGDGLESTLRSKYVAHVVGHLIGLDHIDDIGSIMGQTLGLSATFQDACLPLTASSCPQHIDFCPDVQQNSYAELEATFGLR